MVRIEQMFSCRFSFTGRLCGLLLCSCYLWFLIFALSGIDLWAELLKAWLALTIG